MKPDAYMLKELDDKGNVVRLVLMQSKPKEVSWFKDLPSKKHTIVISELYIDPSKDQKFDGIKSYKESTKRLIEANLGL